MPIKIFKHIVYCFCFLMTCDSSFAQLQDVYSGKSIEVEHRVIKFSPTISFVKSELDFACIHIKNNPTNKTDLVNEKILDLYKSYLLSEEKFRPVYQKMLSRIDSYHKFENTQNTDEIRDNSADKSNVKLMDVECSEISLVSNLLFFSVNFKFWLEFEYDEGIEINISEFYHINLNNGAITKLDFNWNASQKELIMANIKDILNSDYSFALTNYKFSDLNEFQNVRKIETNDTLFKENAFLSSENNKKDISSKINLDDADVYWFGWGLIFDFPGFTESSLLYNGNSFEVFVPFEIAKKILKDFDEFSFVNEIEATTTELKDFDLRLFMSKAIDIYEPREITDLIQDNEFSESAKSVKVDYFQMMNDSTKHNHASWQYDFTRSGDLNKTTRWNEKGEVSSLTEFLYSKKGKLLVKANFNKADTYEDCEIYSYNQNGNLIQTIYKNDGESFVHRYFYNGNYIYQMVRYFIKDSYSEVISKNYYDGKELQLGDQTYFLNDSGKITGNKADKYTMYQVQISRNEKNQLVEVHRENDRYNRYYQYDSQGRLELISNFEGSRIGKTEQYHYDGIFPLPKALETFDPSGGHNTHLFFEYTWELY